jgi:hypothetical protein
MSVCQVPSTREHVRGPAGLAALEGAAAARWAAVVPGRLDEQSAGVSGTGLGDRSLAAALAGGALRRHQSEVAAQVRGAREAGEVADLGAQADRGEGVDAAQAAQPGDGVGPGRLGDEPLDVAGDQDHGEDRPEDGEARADGERPLEALGQRDRDRAAGGRDVTRAAVGDRRQDREPERAADLLRGVDQARGQPGSWPSTPLTAAIVIGTNAKPRPTAASRDGNRTSPT